MAIIANGLRPFRRDADGLMIFLRMEDWPVDIPLPDGTEVMRIGGDGVYWPSWNIVLEPDRTVEQVFGWFVVPSLSIEETCQWYQARMKERGWVEVERTDSLPTWALLRYHHPETDVYVEVSIRRNKHLNRTQPMIRRVTIHPWAPSEEVVSEVGTEEVADGEAGVDEHDLVETTEELFEKVAVR